jgi:branched-chain amino acid aminotransferase
VSPSGPSWWNGRLVPAGEVRIAPDDAGFLFGDGLFETLRVDDGRALDVEAHLDRLLAGLRRIEIGLPESREELAEAIAQVAAQAPCPVARLRLTATRGAGGAAPRPTVLLTAAPYEPPDEDAYRRGVTAILLPDPRVDSRGPLAGLKSLCWQANRLALRRAEAAGAFEALLVNERGLLAEGARSNVAVALPEGVFTPPESDGCLPGTVRRRLLESGEIAERSLTPDDLRRAREVVLLNSLVGALPVSRIEEAGTEGRRWERMPGHPGHRGSSLAYRPPA